jgi:hypothetical protein
MKYREVLSKLQFERTTTEKSSFAGPGPKNCKSFGKTDRVLQEARMKVIFIIRSTI